MTRVDEINAQIAKLEAEREDAMLKELAFPQISRQIMMSKLKWRNANATSEICPRI
jgi:hypothetical protein